MSGVHLEEYSLLGSYCCMWLTLAHPYTNQGRPVQCTVIRLSVSTRIQSDISKCWHSQKLTVQSSISTNVGLNWGRRSLKLDKIPWYTPSSRGLTWNSYVEDVCSKLLSSDYVLRQLSEYYCLTQVLVTAKFTHDTLSECSCDKTAIEILMQNKHSKVSNCWHYPANAFRRMLPFLSQNAIS